MHYLSQPMFLRSNKHPRCRTYNRASLRPERQSSLSKHTIRFLNRKDYAESRQHTVEQLQSGLITFSSKDEMEHQFALTFPGDSDNETQKPHLVFIRYGSEAFLKRVFLSGNEDCRELPESSRERDLIKNQASGAELSLLIQSAH
jgi:hypothetical protein